MTNILPFLRLFVGLAVAPAPAAVSIELVRRATRAPPPDVPTRAHAARDPHDVQTRAICRSRHESVTCPAASPSRWTAQSRAQSAIVARAAIRVLTRATATIKQFDDRYKLFSFLS